MAKITVELNRAAVGELLKSREMQAILEAHARTIAGGDYETEVYVAGTRAVAEVSSRNRNNDLLKAMKR